MATSPEPASLSQPVSPPSGKDEERLTLFNRILTFMAPPLQTELLPSAELTPLLAQRREQILTAVLRTMAILGLLSIFAFLPDFIQELMIYLACLALVWLVAWKRQLNYRFRAGLFLSIEYSLAILDFSLCHDFQRKTGFLKYFTSLKRRIYNLQLVSFYLSAIQEILDHGRLGFEGGRHGLRHRFGRWRLGSRRRRYSRHTLVRDGRGTRRGHRRSARG